ncbi:unnamed protein product [Adineta ricciae]|uniref:Nuclear receptor domain-containing protein n=1 Tax=Adineta ricciae TaxID=249248 RepID=A0A815SYU3_ADIRI|nr:unnamed protein product [Adineta ricciae]
MATSNDPNREKKRSTTTDNVCQVCADQSAKKNYGGISCSSCRTFFRRNAFPTKESIKCRYDSHCEVNLLTRKVCAACRLSKCLAIGMSPDYIRKEDLSQKNRKLRQMKDKALPVVTIPQQSALDMPNDTHHLCLNPSDRMLISNVIHAFDTFNPVSEVRRTMLSISTTAQDALQIVQLMSSFYQSLQSFISSIPDFRILTPTEQCSLFQRNMLGLLCIGGMYFMRELGVFDRPENEMLVLPFYGNELFQQARLICQQLECDPVVFKLLLVALAFSSNCYMLHNRANVDRDSLLFGTFRLLGSQNVYIELVWKYLVYTYGHQYSVQQFSVLVKQILGSVKFSFDMYENNQIHQDFIDQLTEHIDTSPNTTDTSIVPLWGKKK